MAEPVEAGPSPLDAARELLGTEEAPEEETGPEETAAQEDEPEAEGADGSSFEIPNLDTEIPDEYREISEMPDFDAEAEAEVRQEENRQQEEDDYEYEDQGLVEERKKRIAAEKRTAWLEEQHIRQNSEKWKAEATKYYPLAQPFIDAGLIKADSRRAFAREAKRVHEVMKPYVAERFLKPLEEALKAREEEVHEQATEERAGNWGPVRTGPGQVPAAATRASQQYEGRKRQVTLVDEVKDLLGFTGGEE